MLQQIAVLTKSNNDLHIVLKNHKEGFHKVQRKLRLVVSERDCFKQLIENYEKNVTSKCRMRTGVLSSCNLLTLTDRLVFTVSGSETTVTDIQLRLRLEMLEKTVAGYKDMCASLEKELQSVKSSPDYGNF